MSSFFDDAPAAEWVRLARSESLGPGQLKLARIGVRQVVLVRTREGLRVFPNRCPHAGAPLSGGQLVRDHLVCPRHQWSFELGTGSCPEHPIYRLRLHEVEEREGWIYARAPEEEIW